MYFSLITPVRGKELAAARAWNGVYSDHQWLWQFFPAPEGSPRNFIFRRHVDGELPRYYLVSETMPVSPSADWQVQSKHYEPAPQLGSYWQFELRANPTVSVGPSLQADGSRPLDAQGKKIRSKRHDVVMHAKRKLLDERGLQKWQEWQTEEKPNTGELTWQACSAWLQSRAAQIGVEFDLQHLHVDAYQQHRVERKADAKGAEKKLLFSSVELSGILQVRDCAKFSQALLQGIGHAKGFGCGLMLIRPFHG